MDKKKLTADLIPDPRLWRLAMAIDFDSLSVMACSIVGEPASVACVIPLESDPSEAVKLLEDTIYDNPLLRPSRCNPALPQFLHHPFRCR